MKHGEWPVGGITVRRFEDAYCYLYEVASEDGWVSLDGLAGVLGVSSRTLTQWIRANAGLLDLQRTGDQVRIGAWAWRRSGLRVAWFLFQRDVAPVLLAGAIGGLLTLLWSLS